MLHITDLVHRYPGAAGAGLTLPAFSLPAGRHAVVLGPSGCGKSTLLHLIAGILTPQQGRLEAAGAELGKLSPREADRWRGRHIGFLPQRLSLVASLSVRENILLSAYASGAATVTTRADELLEALALSDQSRAKPHQLSQGQRQRVALARALFNRPALLLADEPTANLDDASCAAAIALMTTQAAQSGASLIVATHDARVLAAMPAASVLRLPAGAR